MITKRAERRTCDLREVALVERHSPAPVALGGAGGFDLGPKTVRVGKNTVELVSERNLETDTSLAVRVAEWRADGGGERTHHHGTEKTNETTRKHLGARSREGERTP